MKPTGQQATVRRWRHRRALVHDTDQRRQRSTSPPTAQALRGVAFTDDGKDAERGLSWSDMADAAPQRETRTADPIVDALEAAGIPFLVTGMTNLFQATAEAEAARQLFYFMAGRDHGVRRGGG